MLITDYSIVEAVFNSSRSIIYRAIKTGSEEFVLIKLACQGSSSDEFSEAAWLEYDILQKLDGNGALVPTGLVEFGNGPAIILDDFDGEPLDQYMADAPLDPNLFFYIAVQLVDILG